MVQVPVVAIEGWHQVLGCCVETSLVRSSDSGIHNMYLTQGSHLVDVCVYSTYTPTHPQTSTHKLSDNPKTNLLLPLAGWGPTHLVASSTFFVNSLHVPLSSAMIIHSWPFIPALSRSRLTQSFHHSFGLPLLLLPPSSASHALFDSLSSPILCTCPAHLILLPTAFTFRCFFMPVSSLNSFIFLLSSWVTLHIPKQMLHLY